MVSHRTGLIVGLTIGIVALVLCAAVLLVVLTRRRRIKIKTTEEGHPSAPAAYTTEEQINQAVERKFAAEKASRTVHIVSEPIDTISIDSDGKDRVRASPKVLPITTSNEVLDTEGTADQSRRPVTIPQ